MKTNFIARTAKEAQHVFGNAFYQESRPAAQPELDERVQLANFLRSYALSNNCSFPIEVNILPRNQRPDFEVIFGNADVGIEASKIANPELEEVRSAQRNKKLGAIEISSLLQRQSPKSLNQRIVDCTRNPVFIFPDANQMRYENAFWLEQARYVIMRKHIITKQQTFNRFGATWLLLWDKLSHESELESRIELLADWLIPFWNSSFFEKVIVQHQYFDRVIMLSRHSVELLRNEPTSPVTKFSLSEDFVL